MQGWTLHPPKMLSEKHRNKALIWQQQLTKPAGSLGQLERLAIDLAAMQHRLHPQVQKVNISVFAADNGVCAEGVSAFPQAVTGQMVANFVNGGAAISVLAKVLGASLDVVHLGTLTSPPKHPQIIACEIAPQSGNIAQGPAMTVAQLELALLAGQAAVNRAVAQECELFIGGEMGIGNTTAATAVLARLLNMPAVALVGPGTGLDSAGVSHKAAVIERALALHGDATDALDVLRCLGGFEIAALVGSYIASAQAGVPVLVDGFICTAAALVACRMNAAVRPWLLFAHTSAEPGHQAALQALAAVPLLNLGLRLGEASGAAVAVPLLRIACELHNGMATFSEAGVAAHHE